MSEESKTYIFPDGGTRGSSAVDPNVLLAMMNGGNSGFGGNGNWLWVIFLFFLYGWGGNGMFGRGNNGGLAGEINNDYGRGLLLQAINGNGTAISQLASTLNCDVNAIRTAIGSVQSSVQSVGSQVGMSGQQIINAIQAGNQTIAAQLAQCCCDNKTLVTTQGYENRIATAEQTSLLAGKIDAQTTLINDKFCALEMRDMQSKIDTLTAEKTALQNHINNAAQTSQIQSYIASVVSPIAADVATLKASAPPTVAVPYPQLSAVPSAYANSLYGYGYATSIWS